MFKNINGIDLIKISGYKNSEIEFSFLGGKYRNFIIMFFLSLVATSVFIFNFTVENIINSGNTVIAADKLFLGFMMTSFLVAFPTIFLFLYFESIAEKKIITILHNRKLSVEEVLALLVVMKNKNTSYVYRNFVNEYVARKSIIIDNPE